MGSIVGVGARRPGFPDSHAALKHGYLSNIRRGLALLGPFLLHEGTPEIEKRHKSLDPM